IKRDLSLGIESVLPNHVALLGDLPESELDIWKIRVDEKYLREVKDKYFHLVSEEAPLKWIELFKKGIK
ncbi:hypothetical protein, partial [Corallococcus praedator]|uniref:hypothetical protein n=1 Tax=Corallococcus praedator TaxID=2316724 RepID=UPI001315AC7F